MVEAAFKVLKFIVERKVIDQKRFPQVRSAGEETITSSNFIIKMMRATNLLQCLDL